MTADVLRRKAFSLALVLGCTASAGAATAWSQAPAAQARVVLAPVPRPAFAPDAAASAGSAADPAAARAVTEAAVARSDAVLAAAAKALAGGGATDPVALDEVVAVRADSSTLVVRACAPSAARARDVADAVVAAYRRSVASAVGRRADVVVRAARSADVATAVRAEAAAFGDGVLLADPARTLPRTEGAVVRGAGVGLVGLLLAVAVVLRREACWAGHAWARRIAAAAGVPLVGVVARRPVPAVQRLAVPGSPSARAFEATAAALDALAPAARERPCAGRRTVLVVPARPRRSPGTGAAELAAAFGRLGPGTVLARLEDRPLAVAPDRGPHALGRHDEPPEIVVAPSYRAAPDVAVVRVAGAPAGPRAHGAVDLGALCSALPEAVEVVVLQGAHPLASGAAVQAASEADLVLVEADRRATPADVAAVVDRVRLVGAASVLLLVRPGGPLASLWAWAQADLSEPVPALPDAARAAMTPARHPNRAGVAVGGAPAGWWSPGSRTTAGRS